jgi:uridine kinase
MSAASGEEAETGPNFSAGSQGSFLLSLRAAVKTMLVLRASSVEDFVLLIGGPGCAGKSWFALELASELARAGSPASVLDLDCYLLERRKRETGGVAISGYNPSGYLLEDAARDIQSLISGRPITVSPYDKRTTRRAPEVRVEPAKVLIVEGSMALQDLLYPFGDAAIFLDSTQQILFANRVRREKGYGMTQEQIEQKFSLLREDYFKFIRPQRVRADLLVQIDCDYAFTKVEATQRPASAMRIETDR